MRFALIAINTVLKNNDHIKIESLLSDVLFQGNGARGKKETAISLRSLIQCVGYGSAPLFPSIDSPIVNILSSVYMNRPEYDFITIRLIQALNVIDTESGNINVQGILDSFSNFYPEDILISVLNKMFLDMLIGTEFNHPPSETPSSNVYIEPKAKCLLKLLMTGNELILMFRDDSWLADHMTNIPSKNVPIIYGRELSLTMDFMEYILEREELEIERIYDDNQINSFNRLIGDTYLSEILILGLKQSMLKRYGIKDFGSPSKYTTILRSLEDRVKYLKEKYQ